VADTTSVGAKNTLTSADGTKLAYRAWPVKDASITFAVVHGFAEHSGRYERFARGMAEHGMATYAVDLRGHGESDGQRGHVDSWSQWVDDASTFIGHVESAVKGEVVPLGHSFGGAVMLSTALAGKLRNARRFVVSSPALRLNVKVPAWKLRAADLTARIKPRLVMTNEVDPSTVSRIPEVVEAYRTDPLVFRSITSRTFSEWRKAAANILARANQIHIPFLILAGTADKLIDPTGSVDLHAQAAARSELHLLEGRYHEPFNDLGSDEVFAIIAQWLKKR
jgi:alpha-beta hydrolase superfamily lysophospholipase